MKRLIAFFLCLSLMLGSIPALAEGGSISTPRDNITDTTGPNIVKFVFEEDGKTLKPGDVLHVKMKLDDRSGISTCSVTFRDKKDNLYLGIDLKYDAASDMYKGEHTLSKNDADGLYIISSIYASDVYDNSTHLQSEEKSLGSFTLEGGIKDIMLKGTAKIRENGKTVKPDDEIHIEVKLDTPCPQAVSAWAVFYEAGKDTGSFSNEIEIKSSKVSEGPVWLMPEFHNGKHELRYIEYCDEEFNTVGILKVTGQYVRLTGALTDRMGPTLSSPVLKEKGKTLTAGDKINVAVKARDGRKIKEVSAIIRYGDNVEYTDDDAKISMEKISSARIKALKYNKSTGMWEASWKLPKDLPDGTYVMAFSASDDADNYSYKVFENLTFTYSSPDIVEKGTKAFITTCWKALWNKKPTSEEVQEYGMQLASGKKKAVNIIKILLKKSGLSGEAAAEALWKIMQGKDPSDRQKAKTVEALKAGTNNGIDYLNNSVFRERCNTWGINAGSLETGAASTKVASVDVDGGHYTLSGSNATFTGVTDKNIKKLVIKDTVTANGKEYKVTKIDGAACKGLKNLASVTIGKNVTSIGVSAFDGCGKLSKIVINAVKLKTVGANSFKDIQRKAVFQCPKKQKASYEKLIRKKGKAPNRAKFE